jgi:hypothetical protein
MPKLDDKPSYNPGDLHAAEQFPEGYVTHGLDQIGAHANDPVNRTKNNPKDTDQPEVNAAADAAKQESAGPWRTVLQGDTKKKNRLDIKALRKNGGPASLIIALLLGGGGIFSFMAGGGGLLVHIKEIYTEKFSDQLAVLDARATAVMKTQLEGTTTGICGTKITIRCKMNTMSKSRFEKKIRPTLEEKGFTVESSRTLNPKKVRITKMISPEGVTITARNYQQMIFDSPSFRTAMFQAIYNPKFAMAADKFITSKVHAKLGIRKNKNIDADAAREVLQEAGEEGAEALQQELAEELQNKASGDANIEADANVRSSEVSCDPGSDGCSDDGTRREYFDAQTGETISEGDYNARIDQATEFGNIADEIKARDTLTDTGSTIAKSTIKGALTSTALGLGAVDTGCTGYQLIRTVSFMAKYLGALQLIRYAFVFLNTADSIKAGDAQPEEVELLGNIVTSPNAEGLTGTDSYGYKYVAYGDVAGMPSPEDVEGAHDSQGQVNLTEEEQNDVLLHDEVLKYVNGQVVSESLLGTLAEGAGAATTQAMDDFCGFVKSGWGQTILISAAVVGAVVGFFTGGISIGWGTGAQIAASVAVGIAIAILTPKLADMAAGTMINGEENGNQAINAFTSGVGGYNDQASQTSGIPNLTPEAAVAYNQLTEATLARNAEVESLGVSQFDATNPHTFMGKLASHVTPFFSGISDIGSFFSSVGKFISNTFARIFPSVSAADPGAEFAVCQDMDYEEMGIAVDPFCNSRHGMSAEALAVSTSTPLQFMLQHNLVDEETGEPTDDDNEYAKYIENCMDRTVSIGGYTEDNPSKGEECIVKENSTPITDCTPNDDGTIPENDPCRQNCTAGSDDEDAECRRNMFRLFYVDQRVLQTFDEGYANETTTVQDVNGPVSSPVLNEPTIVNGYGPRSAAPGSSSATWGATLDIASTSPTVLAIMEGEVTAIEGDTQTVVIKHADGLLSRYSYMKNIAVEKGDTVNAGDAIGEIGCTGRPENCNPHLGFAIWANGVTNPTNYSQYPRAPQQAGTAAGRAINPANFLTDNGVQGYEGAVNQE